MFKAILISSVIIAVSALIPFYIWFTQDEAPLDYSELAVEIGPNDPDINGYTLMREFADSYEVVGMDDYELGMQDKVEDWDIPAVKAAIKSNQKLLDSFSTALGMSVVCNDQAQTPETLIPEVGKLRNYTKLRIYQARLFEHDENAIQAFKQLLNLSNDLSTYSKAEGALIHLLVSVATTAIVEMEYYRMLTSEIPNDKLIHFAKHYRISENWSEVVQNAYRQEFWFSMSCIKLIESNPKEFMADLTTSEANSINKVLYSGLLFKKNRTINRFFILNKEIINESSKYVKERNFSFNNTMNTELENRPKTWWLSRNPMGKVLYTILIPAHSKVLEAVDKRQTYGKLLRLVYALKAYYLQNGSLPEELLTLVPKYIDAIPLDPFDGEPLRYSKARGVVYSVGNDLIDNGGSKLPFSFNYKWNEDADEVAENDITEPTLALRFLPQFPTHTVAEN